MHTAMSMQTSAHRLACCTRTALKDLVKYQPVTKKIQAECVLTQVVTFGEGG